MTGELSIGEASATPVIRSLKEAVGDDGLIIADSPPGTACPAVETLRGSDHVMLVTEPTPFGLHDLRLAVETCRELSLAMSVVINRCDIGDCRVHDYCADEGIPISAEIPNSRDVAYAYARGKLPLEDVPAFAMCIDALASRTLRPDASSAGAQPSASSARARLGPAGASARTEAVRKESATHD
jgi:MinD superfamily P-loop ATPase